MVKPVNPLQASAGQGAERPAVLVAAQHGTVNGNSPRACSPLQTHTHRIAVDSSLHPYFFFLSSYLVIEELGVPVAQVSNKTECMSEI